MICQHFLELTIRSHVLITPLIYNCPFFSLYSNNFSQFLTVWICTHPLLRQQVCLELIWRDG